jgi:hypothetical protein
MKRNESFYLHHILDGIVKAEERCDQIVNETEDKGARH